MTGFPFADGEKLTHTNLNEAIAGAYDYKNGLTWKGADGAGSLVIGLRASGVVTIGFGMTWNDTAAGDQNIDFVISRNGTGLTTREAEMPTDEFNEMNVQISLMDVVPSGTYVYAFSTTGGSHFENGNIYAKADLFNL